jgi:hypothetical protein
MKILFQNKQKNTYTEKEMHMSMKLNKNKRQENIFNKKKKIVLESLRLKRMILYKKFK